jgi:hypothetical protein
MYKAFETHAEPVAQATSGGTERNQQNSDSITGTWDSPERDAVILITVPQLSKDNYLNKETHLTTQKNEEQIIRVPKVSEEYTASIFMIENLSN